MEPSPQCVLRPAVDPDRTEGNPLTPLAADDSTLADALTTVLATDPEAVSRPGQLRQRLERTLGAEQSGRLRPLVHQVVVAAEENLPGHLTGISPLTGQSLHQLSAELAAARGWNQATAQRVTQIWAHALGFGAISDRWPTGEPAPMPAPVRLADGATALPSSATPHAATWPPVPRRLSKHHRTSSTGDPVVAAAWGYAGMPLQAYIAIVLVVVALIVLAFVLTKVIVGGLVVVLVVLLLRKAQRPGALLATAHGLEFVPYTVLASKPRDEGWFSAPWPLVTLDEGTFSVLQLDGRRVQLGPMNRAFARAAAAYAGGGV